MVAAPHTAPAEPPPPDPATAPGLHFRSIRLCLDGTPLFAPLSVSVAPGRIASIMGPSGAGKSSLLGHLTGTLDPAFEAAGAVWLDGVRIDGLPPERRRLGLLFQDDLLFPHLSVAGNLLFALPGRGRRRDRRRQADAALAAVGLAGFGDRDPATLSGGQRARVALLRTLLAAPRAVLLDEPFSRLDAGLKAGYRRLVFDHIVERGLPALLVTHDPADAAEAGGPVITLEPASAG